MPKKHKFEGFLDVFEAKLDKIKKQIEKYRKTKNIDKTHIRRLIKEAKELRDLLKDR